MDGILPLYKPKGYTSHDCVMKIRKLLNIKKVGHTGTLDPEVEGVLPICIGEATKIIPFLLNLKKVYIADVFLGQATTTEDAQGEIVAETAVLSPPTDAAIHDVLQKFHGEITQIPPMYSAVKVKGKKLYEYARENKVVKRPERIVTIHQIERIKTIEEKNNPFRIKVTCSKGTYIRTLCVDIGKELGYPAHMSYLQRVESDSITLAETVTFSQIEEAIHMQEVQKLLLPIDRGLAHLQVVNIDERVKKKVLHGQKLPVPEEKITSDPFRMKYKDELLAIYEYHKENKHEIKPIRVFNVPCKKG